MTPTAPFPVEFDGSDPATIARWVLEFPFLKWDPVGGGLPELQCTLVNEGTEPTVAQFQIQSVLGHGGFGVVFLGERDGEQLAIKIPCDSRSAPLDLTRIADEIAAKISSGDHTAALGGFQAEVTRALDRLQQEHATDRAIRRTDKFEREATILPRIKHANVVELRWVARIGLPPTAAQAQTTDSLTCVVMTYVEGRKLSNVIKAARSADLVNELPDILRVGRDVALALGAIHDQDVNHRDLSWSNILLTDCDGRPIVIDLGNVNDPDGLLDSQLNLLETSDFPIPLTLGFVTPEHIDFWRPEAPADQFALGVVLYLWCCGAGAWPYQPKPLGQFITGNWKDPEQPVPMKKRRASLLPDPAWTDGLKKAFRRLSDVIQRMLQKTAADRYPNIRDVAAEFQSILIDLGEEAFDDLDIKELTPVDEFAELCRQVGFESPEPAHGSLFLQLVVRQARLQLGKSIQHVWPTLYDTFHTSRDIGTIGKARTAADQIESMVNDLSNAMKNALACFSQTQQTASRIPRFGGRLQRLLADVVDASRTLTRHSVRLSTVVRRFEQLPDHATDDEKSGLKDEAKRLFSESWDLISEAQEKYALLDFDLALYSVRVGRLRSRISP